MRDLFRRGGVETAELDARLLAELAFGMERLELVNREREAADPLALEKLQALATRRLKGEPVARILGHKEFWGLDFSLNAATLVPRPETEMLVQKCLDVLDGRQRSRILDLGTGTGCIAIAVLTESHATSAVAVDVAVDAVTAAMANGRKYGVTKRLDVRRGSWFVPVAPSEKFDVIVSNPPYVVHDVVGRLQPEVREHDPHAALDGGADGLDAYRAILKDVAGYIRPSGALIVEIGADQGKQVREMFIKAGLSEVTVEKDLAGLDRMVSGYHS